MITSIDKQNAIPFKIIIIGDSSSGKSSLLLKLVNGTFDEKHKVTIGVDFKAKHVLVDDKILKLKIWDTAGQERFRSVIRSYYHGTNGIVLVFDLTDRDSFNNLHNWMNDINDLIIENTSIILIGNKCDLTSYKTISQNEINDFIKKYNCNISYFECSSKLGTGIDKAFVELGKKMLMTEIKEDIGSLQINDAEKLVKSDYSSSCCIIN